MSTDSDKLYHIATEEYDSLDENKILVRQGSEDSLEKPKNKTYDKHEISFD